METKPLSVTEEVNPVVLYFDDLLFLMTLFGESSKEISLRINDTQNEYEFTSTEELSALKDIHTEKFNNLSITGHQPYVTLNLWKHGGELRISQDTAILRGLMAKAKDRLKLRTKKLHWIYTPPWMAAPPIVALWLGVWELGYENYFSGTAIILLSLIWLSLNWYSRFYNYTIIFSKTKKELPSFLQRKKDEILLTVIATVFGAVIGAAITKWIGT